MFQEREESRASEADQLMHQLEAKCTAHNSGEDWTSEKLRVRSQLDSLCDELSLRFSPETFG